ncbi:MAG: methanogenesis marker 17 protein [Methanomicrobia archaeon]|nr:methanogenesis marker 17 protein [Methanomicrobia archaeon]
MEVKVEGGDDFANTTFAKISQATFRDLGVRASIDNIYIYIDPTAHFFVISVKIGRVASPVTVRDMTQREPDRLKITDERYAPNLLSVLWDTYGARIKQVSRLEIEFELDEKERVAMMDLLVYDPKDDLITRILDGIDRILPEGARVRCPIPLPDRVTLLASEDPIGPEWEAKAEEIVRKGSTD